MYRALISLLIRYVLIHCVLILSAHQGYAQDVDPLPAPIEDAYGSLIDPDAKFYTWSRRVLFLEEMLNDYVRSALKIGPIRLVYGYDIATSVGSSLRSAFPAYTKSGPRLVTEGTSHRASAQSPIQQPPSSQRTPSLPPPSLSTLPGGDVFNPNNGANIADSGFRIHLTTTPDKEHFQTVFTINSYEAMQANIVDFGSLAQSTSTGLSSLVSTYGGPLAAYLNVPILNANIINWVGRATTPTHTATIDLALPFKLSMDRDGFQLTQSGRDITAAHFLLGATVTTVVTQSDQALSPDFPWPAMQTHASVISRIRFNKESIGEYHILGEAKFNVVSDRRSFLSTTSSQNIDIHARFCVDEFAVSLPPSSVNLIYSEGLVDTLTSLPLVSTSLARLRLAVTGHGADDDRPGRLDWFTPPIEKAINSRLEGLRYQAAGANGQAAANYTLSVLTDSDWDAIDEAYRCSLSRLSHLAAVADSTQSAFLSTLPKQNKYYFTRLIDDQAWENLVDATRYLRSPPHLNALSKSPKGRLYWAAMKDMFDEKLSDKAIKDAAVLAAYDAVLPENILSTLERDAGQLGSLASNAGQTMCSVAADGLTYCADTAYEFGSRAISGLGELADYFNPWSDSEK